MSKTAPASVRETLRGAGYEVRAEKYALARSDARFFGVLDLATPLAEGVSLSVGVRNSVDKSFPLGSAREALAYVESGRAVGKVVLRVVEP